MNSIIFNYKLHRDNNDHYHCYGRIKRVSAGSANVILASLT